MPARNSVTQYSQPGVSRRWISSASCATVPTHDDVRFALNGDEIHYTREPFLQCDMSRSLVVGMWNAIVR